MSVEQTLVKMNRDTTPPAELGRALWVSKPQRRRVDAKTLAGLAIYVGDFAAVACPKIKAVRNGQNWRGVVYAGRRSRREVAKEGAKTSASQGEEA